MNIKSITILSLFFIALGGCTDSVSTDDEVLGNWTRKSDFEGVGRSGAVSFMIGERVFVGTGFDGTNRLQDFWEYSASLNTWFRIADFPGVARNGAVAFAIGDKGYVGTGYDGTNRLNDFWQYDPEANTWTQVADFAGSGRFGAVAVAIAGRGFIGAGYDGSDLKDWWEYDDDNDAWVQKVSIGGAKRTNAFAFELNGKGYVGGGQNNGIFESDFWEYDPETDTWEGKNDLINDDEDDGDDYSLLRNSTSTFTIAGYAYIVGGSTSEMLSDVWEYEPVSDTWTSKTAFEGVAREDAIGFAVGSYGYVTTGRSLSLRFDDIWMFDPLEEADEE